jgi:metallo-beta-lactamase class B
MKQFALSAALFITFVSLVAAQGALRPDPPRVCDDCEAWNAPRPPSRVFGNTYYVGVAGLSSVLITSDAGHILVDGALTQSAVPIDASIRKLGFKTEDVKLIVNSHTHYDHAGGIAALQRASGARVAASPAAAAVLKTGIPTADDPQAGFGPSFRIPAVANVETIPEGVAIRIGPLSVTPHFTPGHTPGGTTWTWQSCEGSVCKNLVYVDSLTPVSAPGFRYTGDATRPSIVNTFRQSIDKVAALPCDLLIAAHPAFGEGKTCKTLAADAHRLLDNRVAEEGKTPGAKPGPWR